MQALSGYWETMQAIMNTHTCALGAFVTDTQQMFCTCSQRE